MFQFIKRYLTSNKTEQRDRLPEGTIHYLQNHLGSLSREENVNEDTTVSLPAIYDGINQIAEQIAMLPLFLYRTTDGAGREKATSDRRYRMLHAQPNDFQNKYQFWQQVIFDSVLWSNAFILLSKDAAGFTNSMFRIRPDAVTVRIQNGVPVYDVQAPINGRIETQTYDFTRIMHIKGRLSGSNHRNALQPEPLFTQLARSLGININTDEHTSKFYKNGTHLAGIVKSPNKLDSEQTKAIKDSWREKLQGMSNAHDVAIIGSGMEYVPLTQNAEQAQLIEGRKFNVVEVARILGVPPSKLKAMERATYATAEQEAINFRSDSIQPRVTAIEAEIESKIIRSTEKGLLKAEFELAALERADISTRYDVYVKGINNGILSINDARALENMNPVSNGDTHFVPLNLQKLGASNPNDDGDSTRQSEPAENTTELRYRVQSAYRTLFDDAFRKIADKEYKALSNALKKYENHPADFDKWASNFYANLEKDIYSRLYPIVDSALEQLEHIVTLQDDRENIISELCTRAATNYVSESKQYLSNARNIIGQWVQIRTTDTATVQSRLLKQITNEKENGENENE